MCSGPMVFVLLSLAFFAISGEARARQVFSENPIPSTTTFVYNEFMQLVSASDSPYRLHTGIDCAGETGDPVVVPLSAGNAQVLGVTENCVFLVARDRQAGSYACFQAIHLNPNPVLAPGMWIDAADPLGTLDANRHLHAEIFLSADAEVMDADLRNPRLHGLENAPWITDTMAPVLDTILAHWGVNTWTFRVKVHDQNEHNPSYYNGIQRIELRMDDRLADSILLDAFEDKSGLFPPDAGEIYYDPSAVPVGTNNPNVLEYVLSCPAASGDHVLRVLCWDAAGNSVESPPMKPTVVMLSDEETPAPSSMDVSSYPNPSSSSFTIRLRMPREEEAAVEVFTAAGRKVRTIHQGSLPRGILDRSWDGRDERGRPVPPGAYLIRMQTRGTGSPPETFVRKVSVVR